MRWKWLWDYTNFAGLNKIGGKVRKKNTGCVPNKISKMAEVWGTEYNYDSEPEMLIAAEERVEYNA